MKKILLSFIAAFALNACNNDDKRSEIDKLPQATQTGAGTIGCLVNGKALVPYGYLETKSVCQYDGENLVIAVGEERNNEIHSVHVYSYSRKVSEGQVYKLNAYGSTSVSGEYRIYTDTGDHAYKTNSAKSGELKITHLDSLHNIISGTFWFDAEDSNGQKIEVREGRFDMRAD